jgi:hypothetical protein
VKPIIPGVTTPPMCVGAPGSSYIATKSNQRQLFNPPKHQGNFATGLAKLTQVRQKQRQQVTSNANQNVKKSIVLSSKTVVIYVRLPLSRTSDSDLVRSSSSSSTLASSTLSQRKIELTALKQNKSFESTQDKPVELECSNDNESVDVQVKKDNINKNTVVFDLPIVKVTIGRKVISKNISVQLSIAGVAISFGSKSSRLVLFDTANLVEWNFYDSSKHLSESNDTVSYVALKFDKSYDELHYNCESTPYMILFVHDNIAFSQVYAEALAISLLPLTPCDIPYQKYRHYFHRVTKIPSVPLLNSSKAKKTTTSTHGTSFINPKQPDFVSSNLKRKSNDYIVIVDSATATLSSSRGSSRLSNRK